MKTIQDSKKDAICKLLRGFSAGLIVPTIAYYLKGQVTIQEIEKLLPLLEEQGRVRGDRPPATNPTAPIAWHAVSVQEELADA